MCPLSHVFRSVLKAAQIRNIFTRTTMAVSHLEMPTSTAFRLTNNAGIPTPSLLSLCIPRRELSILSRRIDDTLCHVSKMMIVHKRLKKKSAGSAKAAVDEDFEEEVEAEEVVEAEDDGIPKDYKVVTAFVHNPRLDTLFKAALGTSRSSVEKAFYEGKLRYNGEKIVKKGVEVAVGDELDFIIGNNTANPDFLDVNRVFVEDIGTATVKSKIGVTLHLWKNMTVENYKPPHNYTLSGS